MTELTDLVITDPRVQQAYDQGYDRGYRAGLRETPEPPKVTTRKRLVERADQLFAKADELWRAGDADPGGRAARLELLADDLVRRARVVPLGEDADE